MMHSMHFNQPIVLKRLFLILLFILGSGLGYGKSLAQSSNIVNNTLNTVRDTVEVTGESIVTQLKSGDISLSSATNSLSQLSNLPSGSASQLLTTVVNGNNLSIPDASKLIDGFIGENSIFKADSVSDVIKIADNIQKGLTGNSGIGGLVDSLTGGKITADVGKVLSGLSDLGSITDIKSIGDIFKNSNVTESISNLLDAGETATKALGAISDITKIISDPTALLNDPKLLASAAKTITDALKTVAPNLAGALESLTGGLESALSESLSNALTENALTDTDEGDECGASCKKCKDCAPKINLNHETIRAHVTSEFEQHRNWLVTTYFIENILPNLMRMTTQLTATGMQQVQIIGGFFDAKHQLETQRLFQVLSAKAHKDYHPSEGLCEIGTGTRSLAGAERQTNLTHAILSHRMMDRQLSSGDTIAFDGEISDRKSRLNLFIKKFCNPNDHANGLQLLCKKGGKSKNQVNIDVNYTNAIENKLTLDVDFGKDGASENTEDEENIFALGANLFANDVLPTIPDNLLVNRQKKPTTNIHLYLDVRAVAAKRSVAQNSFAAITALKSEGNDESAPFLKAILAEAGINPKEIEDRLGEKPSYFAQMEVLTKDIYQNPKFYSNLYDKPVNIERKGAALQAIELMQDRDIYRSLLRSEAVLATLLETLAQKEHARIANELGNLGFDGERIK